MLLPLAAAVAVAILLYYAPPAVRLVSCGGVAPLIFGLPLLPLGTGKNRRWYRLKDVPGTKAVIVLAARNLDRLRSVAEEIEALGVKALPIACDVTDSEQVNTLIEKALTEFGRY